jgi:hypothetical protein
MTLFASRSGKRIRAMKTSQHLRSGRRSIWTTLVLAGLATPGCLAAAAVFTPATAASVYKVYTGENDIATLVLRGQIVAGDLGRLQGVTAKVPPNQRIVLMLESPGGNVDEAIAIGRYVYTAKIMTVAVQGPGCHSSCSFVFLAGRDHDGQPLRIMMKGARVGFHQGKLGTLPSNKNYSASDMEMATAAGQEIIRRIDAYFQEIKADPEFLRLVLSAPNRSITLLNEFDALRLGIYVMDSATQKVTTPADFKR